MRRYGIWLLMACIFSFAAFHLGCGGGGSSGGGATPFLILGMDNGSTGYEPYMVKDNVATLLKDVNPGPGSSSPWGYFSFNGKVYFQAYDATNGTELWVTDGTAAGTALLKDINPGAGHSSPAQFVSFNGKLYFRANDGAHAFEPWVTDGTAAGTVLLKDINPGAGGSDALMFFRPAVTYGGYQSGTYDKLWFIANDGTAGYELWTTDGTTAGTAIWSDFKSGPGDGVYID